MKIFVQVDMRKKVFYYKFLLLLHFSLVLFSNTITAQDPRLDSLLQVVKTMRDDTSKVNTYHEITRIYFLDYKHPKMKEYVDKELALAQTIHDQRGTAYAFINLGSYYSRLGSYNKAVESQMKALKIMETLKDKKGEGTCYLQLGLTNSNNATYKKALEYMAKGVELKALIGDKKGMATGYNNMANIFQVQGDNPKALAYHLKSLKLHEELHYPIGMCLSYNNIANIFAGQNKLDEALAYYMKGVKIGGGNNSVLALLYDNIGQTYVVKGQLVKALEYDFKCLKIREKSQDKLGIAQINMNIGGIYLLQQQKELALLYQLKAYKLFLEVGDKPGTANVCGGIGNLYESQKKFNTAQAYYEQMLKIAKEIQYKEGIKQAYHNLSSLYKKQKQYEKALAYTELFNATKDSLLNKENFKQINELNTKYETDKKENEILLLTKDQQLNAKIIRQQQLVRWGLLCGLGLLSISIFSIYRRYRFKQKANIILEQQKTEIQQKNTLITDSIEYAKTIQEAVLPTRQEIMALLPQSFILYKPKATVSGDFYWINNIDDRLVCAVADCTGHGVPGAFMSLLGYNMLENVTKTNDTVTPALILNVLNQEVATRLAGDDHEASKHGMDISLITIDKTTNRLEFAGAHNSLYIVRDGILIELKADKWGIGNNEQRFRAFTNQSLELKKEDMIYLFTDGFPDQIGGTKRKKFYYQPFKDLLLTISTMSPEEQKMKLDEAHTQWMGSKMDQTDDILIMGIRYV
jgi:serine phosphatase RsbU (regulator of sigma subunit)